MVVFSEKYKKLYRKGQGLRERPLSFSAGFSSGIEARFRALSGIENRCLARQLCWRFTWQFLEKTETLKKICGKKDKSVLYNNWIAQHMHR